MASKSMKEMRAHDNENEDPRVHEIVAWLRKTLRREDVTFEVTPQSLDKLYSVMRHSQRSVAEAEHVIAAQEEAREEYCIEGERIQKVLSQFGMSTESMSQSGLTSLRTLSEVGNLLGISDTRPGTYITALHTMQSGREEVSEKLQRARLRQKLLKSKLDEVGQSEEKLQRHWDRFTATQEGMSATTDMRVAQIQSHFSKEVQQAVHGSMMKHTAALGSLDKDVEHQALVDMASKVEALAAKLGPMKETLRGFQDLPPDSALARVQLETVKQDLQRRQDSLSAMTEGEAANMM